MKEVYSFEEVLDKIDSRRCVVLIADGDKMLFHGEDLDPLKQSSLIESRMAGASVRANEGQIALSFCKL